MSSTASRFGGDAEPFAMIAHYEMLFEEHDQGKGFPGLSSRNATHRQAGAQELTAFHSYFRMRVPIAIGMTDFNWVVQA